MKRRLYGKSLPPNQAASIFLLDDPSVSNDRLAMEYCAELVKWRARPATIERLLGVPTRVVTRVVTRDLGEAARMTGRIPASIAPTFASPRLHAELSLFHRAYAEAVHITGESPNSSGVCVTPYMTAFRYACSAPVPVEGEREIDPETAIVLAVAHHADELMLTCCDNCRTFYTQTVTMVVTASTPTRGTCPFCRQLVTRNRRAVVLAPHHADQIRDLLGLPKATRSSADAG